MALEKNQNNSAMEYNNIANSDSAALLPHLETFEKMLKLPVVEAAWHQSQDVYGRVKGKIYIRAQKQKRIHTHFLVIHEFNLKK